MLVGCTPNGAICYVSLLFVNSILDVDITRVCWFIDKLDGKEGISIMADRGFTIKDQLEKFSVTLNIPPFLDGHQQLLSSEVQQGRSIGRIKQFAVLQGKFPLSMSCLANQIVCCVCLAHQFSHCPYLPTINNSK